MRKQGNLLTVLLLAAALRAVADGTALPYTPGAEVAEFHAALRADGQVVVQWRTTAEFGVDAFRVLRRSDADGTWQAAGSGRVNAGGDEAGHTYTLTDLPAAAGTRRQYVLRIVSRSRPDADAATWEGALLPAAPSMRTATPLASLPVAAPLSAPALRQPWIGSGARVQTWTNALPADRVRLSLRDEAVYAVTADELAAASGWNLAAITNALATTNLSLSCQGSPVAWHAEGTNLFFYGVAPQSRFAPENVYWVQFGAGSNMLPLTMTAGVPATTNEWFIDRIQFQGTNLLSRDGSCSLADAPASFLAFAPLLVADGMSLIDTEPLVDCASGSWTGTVTVQLISYYESGTDNHAARVWIGAADVGEPAWSGEQCLSFVYPFSSSSVDAGQATLQIDNTFDDPFLSYSRFLCSSYTYTYPHCYVSRGNALRCTGGAKNTVAVSGFAANDILALDVTRANLPRVVQPLSLAYDTGPGNWMASFPCGGTDSVYAVCSKATGIRQPSVRGVRDVDWTLPANAADYVILVPPEGWRADIRPVLQPLADFRKAQGLVTRIVDVESVYNRFSYGLVDPQAIHAFCCAGYTNWSGRPLRYVLLAGAGSLDFKHDRQSLYSYTACLIPTIVAGQEFPQSNEGMTVALDLAFGDVTGDAAPEVIIGRLPTTSAQSMALVVQKTIAYEGALLWKQQTSVAADWDNTDTQYYPFSAGTDRIVPFLTRAGRTVVKQYPDLSASDPGNLVPIRLDRLFPALASGSGIFHFFGHTGELSLGGGSGRLLRKDDISSDNWTNPTIAVVIGCRINRWPSPTENTCILAYGVFATNTGFVAALGATGYLLSGEGDDLGVALYSQAATNGTLRLGDVLKNGLQQMSGEMPRERLQCFNLTGDPALIFRHDITATGTPVAWLARHGLTAPNADLADPDNDGWPTWQEYRAGTDPTSCVLRITSASMRGADNRLSIGFEANTNGTYRVFHKESLLATDDWQAVSWSWTNGTEWSLQTILPATPIVTVDVPATNAIAVQGFYRVCWTN